VKESRSHWCGVCR